MKVGIVVLNYNDADTTIKYIEQVQSYPFIDAICIVDNHSSDDSYQRLSEINHPKVTIIQASQNNGYASGNNIGLRYLYEQGCDFYVISNPDIVVDEYAWKNYMGYVSSYPQYDVVAPVISEDGKKIRGWKLMKSWYHILDNLIYVNRAFKKMLLYKDSYFNGPVSQVDVVHGCFFGMHKKVIDKIGYFDEGTFLYYEENLLGHKAKNAGLKTAIFNEVEVIHEHSVSIDKSHTRYRKLKMLKESQLYYCKQVYSSKFILKLIELSGNSICMFRKMLTRGVLIKKNTKKITFLVNLENITSFNNFQKNILSKFPDNNLEVVIFTKEKEQPKILDERIQVTSINTSKNIKEKLYNSDASLIVSTDPIFNKYCQKIKKETILLYIDMFFKGNKKDVSVVKSLQAFDGCITDQLNMYTFYNKELTGPKLFHIGEQSISETIKEANTKDIKKRIIFTSSTGGHYSELMELKPIMDKHNSFILTENHPMMAEVKKNNKARSWYLKEGTKEHLFKFLLNIPYNIVYSFIIFRRVRPDIIVSTGAHTTVWICYIAKLFRKKIIFIETFANITTKTLSGRMVYPIADLFLVQWPEMLELYPRAKYKGGLK